MHIRRFAAVRKSTRYADNRLQFLFASFLMLLVLSAAFALGLRFARFCLAFPFSRSSLFPLFDRFFDELLVLFVLFDFFLWDFEDFFEDFVDLPLFEDFRPLFPPDRRPCFGRLATNTIQNISNTSIKMSRITATTMST